MGDVMERVLDSSDWLIFPEASQEAFEVKPTLEIPTRQLPDPAS
jgi:hypothetical protein